MSRNGDGEGGFPSNGSLLAKIRRDDKQFWVCSSSVISAKTLRVWTSLEKGLTQYNKVLKQRKDLVDDITQLQKQNVELKALLRQYLGSAVNDELIIPPTQMIRVHEPAHFGSK